jgi:ATP-dependent DNA helicase PIF1
MLNEKQQYIIEQVITKKNIFLTGCPGTGKSFVLKEIIKKYIDLNLGNLILTATTGCAAVNIKGITLHSFFGIKPHLNISDHINLLLKEKLNNSIFKRIFLIDFLIIDEVSMLDNILCNNIDLILKSVKNNVKPFGDIQVLFVGDFFQLAPVINTYCFYSKAWIELNPILIELIEPIRHNTDKAFQIILSKLRYGIMNKKIFHILKSLENNNFSNDLIEPTILYPNNVDVNNINKINLKKLIDNNNKIKLYKAFFVNTKINNDYDILLAVNAQIMVTSNISIENELINGTRGIIIELNDDNVLIKTKNGLFEIHYHKFDILGNKNKYFKCIPLKLAYAITIHKSQGSTIDKLKIDIGPKVFATGQAYTAISRAKTLNDIHILNLDINSFKADKKVIKWYESQIK